VLVDFPVPTGISFPIEHIKNEPSMRSFSVEVLQRLLGRHFSIDIFTDIVGYALLIAGLTALVRYHKRFLLARNTAIVGSACSILIKAAPFIPLIPFDVLKVVAVIKGIDYFCIILIIFSVARGIFAQVDSYKYLEMWEEFKFCWDIIALAPPFIYLLGVTTVVDFPMAGPLAMIIYGAWLYAGIMFLCYVYTYSKNLKLFE